MTDSDFILSQSSRNTDGPSVTKVFGFGRNVTNFTDYVKHDIPRSNYMAKDQALAGVINSMILLGVSDSYERDSLLEGAKKIPNIKELNPLIISAALVILNKYSLKPTRESFTTEEPIVGRLVNILGNKLSLSLSKRDSVKENILSKNVENMVRIELASYTLLVLKSASFLG